MKTTAFRLTGNTVKRFGIEYQEAQCFDETVNIECDYNIISTDNTKINSINCKGYLDFKGNLDCKGVFFKKGSIYRIGFNPNKSIHIGCVIKTAREWVSFLNSNEVIETKRDTVNFNLIKADILSAIAMQEVIEETIRSNKGQEL